jgi:hypothetical protein
MNSDREVLFCEKICGNDRINTAYSAVMGISGRELGGEKEGYTWN